MSKELSSKTSWCPELLGSQVETIRGGLLRVLGLPRQEASISLGGPVSEDSPVVNSLKEFFQEKKKSGDFDRLVREHHKGDINLETNNLLIFGPFYGRGYREINNFKKERVFVDGDYGFVLGFQTSRCKNPIGFAITSFISIESEDYPTVRQYNKKLTSLSPPPLKNAPIIIELQGQQHYENTHRKRRAYSFLKGLRWEHLLVSLVVEWAQTVKLPAVYILSGSMNEWQTLRDNPLRAKMRYDVTAQRCGFKKEASGLYALHLSYREASHF